MATTSVCPSALFWWIRIFPLPNLFALFNFPKQCYHDFVSRYSRLSILWGVFTSEIPKFEVIFMYRRKNHSDSVLTSLNFLKLTHISRKSFSYSSDLLKYFTPGGLRCSQPEWSHVIFTLPSCINISWIFPTISEVETSFGAPWRFSSKMHIHLNSADQYLWLETKV